MVPHLGVTQETIGNINLKDRIITTDTVNDINKTTLDQLIDSTKMSYEARAGSKTAQTIF